MHILEKASTCAGNGGTTAIAVGGAFGGPAAGAVASRYLRNQAGIYTPSGRLGSLDMLKRKEKRLKTENRKIVHMALGNMFFKISFSLKNTSFLKPY